MTISPGDLSALSRLLEAAMDMAPAEADAWLSGLDFEHRHLLPHLRRLLAGVASGAQGGFLAEGPRMQATEGDGSARAGDMVGPYRLIRELGRGGMAFVWFARHAGDESAGPVALKLPRRVWGADLASRMAREREICARLEHPDIVRLLDAGVDRRGRPYLALEYIDGVALDVWCREQSLSPTRRLRLCLQVARAVAHAHACRIVHRDLKPSNVLVSSDGEAHLLDFGIAKLLDPTAPGSEDLTREQARVLTPHCASPEQLRGEEATVTSDVYSLGVLLYELLTGQHPYAESCRNLESLERAVLAGPPPPASSRATDLATVDLLTSGVDTILATALQTDPDRRFSTADAMADAIEHLLGVRGSEHRQHASLETPS